MNSKSPSVCVDQSAVNPWPDHSSRACIPWRITGGTVVLGILLSGCWTSQPAAPLSAARPAMPEMTSPPAATSPYAGIESCVPCHRERVEDFKKTRHFLAVVEAREVSMPVGFEPGRNVYQSRFPGIRFEMGKTGDQTTMTAITQSPQGEQRQTRSIDFVYGHGAGTDEAYFNWQDDLIRELPMVWLHPQDCWGATPVNPFNGGDYARPLTVQCVSCHFTWVDEIPGESHQFRRETAMMGVTCERCHGPGGEHVAFHQQHKDAQSAHAIVHPGTLSRERLLDVCAQCHDNAIHYRRPAFSFRPGDVLADFVRIAEYKHPEDNHVANQHAGLKASRCFQASDTLTCVTCHDPHHARSADNAGSKSCAQCHKANDCQEHERLPAAVSADCVGCHMPPVNKVQVNFRTPTEPYVAPVKRWEHRIAVYPEARDGVLREYLVKKADDASRTEAMRLTSSLGQFWRKRAQGHLAESRFLMALDAFREAHKYDPSDEIRAQIDATAARQTNFETAWFQATALINAQQHAESIAALRRVLTINPQFARAHGRLGTLLAAAGDKIGGRESLRKAIEIDPDDSYSYGMLGWLAYLDGEFEEARKNLETAVRLDPMSDKLRYQLGLSHIGLGRWEDAVSALRESVRLNPDSHDAWVALARVYQQQTQPALAIDAASRAVQLTYEQNPEVLLLLSECYHGGNQTEAARWAAEQALEIASKSHNSDLVRQAQSRLETIKSGRY